MSSATLTSLAMLKVSVDKGGDYLDYLRPFVLQVLAEKRPDPVTGKAVQDHVRTEFGLEVPERTLQIILKRLSRRYPLKRSEHVYRIEGEIPDPRITARRTAAARHIQSVVLGLVAFSEGTPKPISTEDEAVAAICAFLAEFNIPCLRAYLRGTAIPTIKGRHGTEIVLVSQYVVHLQQADPERFESFLIMLQGHMLANALLCPDLQNTPKTYKGVTFYLDTPLLVRRLGAEGEPRRAAIESLIGLLQRLGATVATFSHSREELEQVLRGAAEHVNAPDGRGAIVIEARRNGVTKSDLLVLAGQVDQKLSEVGVEVKSTPPYVPAFQIDELAFGKTLDDEISYFNPHAKECDINSVRSIYALRGNGAPSTLERSRAVLVTSNSAFARAAYDYGLRYEQSREVSSVITDFSLANMAWLKAPVGAPSLPTVEVLAFSYAALQPSKELLDNYLKEIEKLEKTGKITERDHQLLRSSTLAQDELMKLTMGDDAALGEGTVMETLQRVSREIKKEERQQLIAERLEHRRTQDALTAERTAKTKLQERLYWRCRRTAGRLSTLASALLMALLVAGLLSGIGLRPKNAKLGWFLTIGSGAVLVLSLVSLYAGTTVKKLQRRMQDRILAWLITREAAASGVELPAQAERE